jgi:hypothetical protein
VQFGLLSCLSGRILSLCLPPVCLAVGIHLCDLCDPVLLVWLVLAAALFELLFRWQDVTATGTCLV